MTALVQEQPAWHVQVDVTSAEPKVVAPDLGTKPTALSFWVLPRARASEAKDAWLSTFPHVMHGVVVHTPAAQASEPVLELVRATPYGQIVKSAAEGRLSHLSAQGYVKAFQLVEISNKAVRFDVEVLHTNWSTDLARRIQEEALELQETYDATVLFDVRRTRARHQ